MTKLRINTNHPFELHDPRHPQSPHVFFDRLLRWSPDEKDRIGELIRALEEHVFFRLGKVLQEAWEHQHHHYPVVWRELRS